MKPVEIYVTKQKKGKRPADPVSIEREVRELLARKVSGTLMGLWLLIPEHLRLGSWDLLTTWSGGNDNEIKARLALQMVHEAAVCHNGIRPVRSLCHQGFELANGLPYIATDQEIHLLLNEHTISQTQILQIALAALRQSRGHYQGRLLAFDPHRIPTYSKRVMPKKKSSPTEPSGKVLQTFFGIDAETGQPLGFTIGSSGQTVTRASRELLEMIKAIPLSYPPACPQVSREASEGQARLTSAGQADKTLLLADTEHLSSALLDYISEDDLFDLVMPVSRTTKIMNIIKGLEYERKWPGYALGETNYQFDGSRNPVRLIGQRTGERESEYKYKPFVATGTNGPLEMLTEEFPQRWSIEEFFNFEGGMGWDKAMTMNLNIRYGKLSLALLAQAATYQLKQKLPKPYRNWTAQHLANSVFHGIDGDLRVQDDTIIVTMYNVPESLNLREHYRNLPNRLKAEGVDPRVPWLYNFKVDFRFK